MNSEHGSHAEKQKLSRTQSGYLLSTGLHYLLLVQTGKVEGDNILADDAKVNID